MADENGSGIGFLDDIHGDGSKRLVAGQKPAKADDDQIMLADFVNESSRNIRALLDAGFKTGWNDFLGKTMQQSPLSS